MKFVGRTNEHSRVDGNHDEGLTKDELLGYVLKNVEQHLGEAKERNSQLFLLIDTKQDGQCIERASLRALWTIREGDVPRILRFARQISQDQRQFDQRIGHFRFHPRTDGQRLSEFSFFSSLGKASVSVQRELVKIRDRRNEANVAGDNELDIDEFLAFRHPEIAGDSSKHIVNDLMLRLGPSSVCLSDGFASKKCLLDRDEDQKLNETEFIVMPSRSPSARSPS